MAGYFDSVLYKDVTLSTVPDTHTPDMFSWFPLYIPIKVVSAKSSVRYVCDQFLPRQVPVSARAGDDFTIHFWRKCDPHKVSARSLSQTSLTRSAAAQVWYEWGVTEPCVRAIHNVAGLGSNIGL